MSEALDHWGQPTPSAHSATPQPQALNVSLASAGSFPRQGAASFIRAFLCDIELLLSSRASSTATLAFRSPVTRALPPAPTVTLNKAKPNKQNLFSFYLEVLIIIYVFTQYSSNIIEYLLCADFVKC